MSLPRSWSEVYERLGRLFASEAAAREWVMQALEQTWGVLDPAGLDRGRRLIALQKASGVVLALEDESGDIAFYRDVRRLVADTFERYFAVRLEGPPWRLSPYEDRPIQAEWERAADFEEVLS